MTTAGSTVKGGFYFSRDKWDIVTVSGKEGVLPGAAGQRYSRLPVLAVLFLAPLLGGLFVVFLPFIGFALVLQHLVRLSLSGMKRAGRGLLFVIAPAWRPGEAYFAGKAHDGDLAESKTDAKTDNHNTKLEK
jgi:hypothetical protein